MKTEDDVVLFDLGAVSEETRGGEGPKDEFGDPRA